MEGRGSGFVATNPVPGSIGPGGEGAAPANLLAELLAANHRPVRLHGAMMLAYLGDPRAREAALSLREALREEEAPYLERLVAAAAEVRACKLEVTSSGPTRSVRACLFNVSEQPRAGAMLKLRALEAAPRWSDPVGAPPAVLAEASFAVPGAIAPRSGKSVAATFDVTAAGETAPEAFEAFVE